MVLTQKDQDHIPCSFSYNLVCTDKKFSKWIVLYGGKDAAHKFIKAILDEYISTKISTKI